MTENKDNMEKRKRKKITHRTKLEVIKRDHYTCKICGKSPAIHLGLDLEVDHVIPFSCGGSDELPNLQTLCINCNRGKGNNERFNRTIKNDLDILLNSINPQILEIVNSQNSARIVANQEDYAKIIEKNSLGNFYQIKIIPNIISDMGAGKNLGIYTIQDNGGSKVNFNLKKNPEVSAY